MQRYEPIACVEFQGQVTNTGLSRGHYICYVKDYESRQWFKTSDEMEPEVIEAQEVSRNIYVSLYKKVQVDKIS